MRQEHADVVLMLYRVSTLIRPEGRMRQEHADVVLMLYRVSTLIRPEGRMRRASPSTSPTSGMFQPSSDPKAGCDTMQINSEQGRVVFQPSSDPKAGCDDPLC